jgi:catechol 2,3-dioxygenase-like lactoylglutathione lyase family enzyme
MEIQKEDKMANLSAIRNNEPITNANAATVDMKLEVVIVPVSDVDRAKAFYARLGWRLDGDFTAGNDWRGVQFTPPGSGCSVIFGKNVTTATPGSAQGLYLAVSDIEGARSELLRRGVDVSDVFHGSNLHTGSDEPYLFGRLRSGGSDPAHTSYYSLASFRDPDGNGWFLQEITTRLAGRGVSNFDVATMTALLRETEEHHGKYEPTAPKHHWSGWYAAYIVARQNGKTPEEAAKEGKLNIEGALAA